MNNSIILSCPSFSVFMGKISTIAKKNFYQVKLPTRCSSHKRGSEASKI